MKALGTKKLETERLILRKIEMEDYKSAYKNWCSDPEVAKHLPWEVHENEEVTKNFFDSSIKKYDEPNTYKWIVIEKVSNEPIGTISVVSLKERDSRAEIGYCYGTKWWGKGYGTEALKAVIDFLLNEIEIEMVIAGHGISNPASGRVMEKAGMKYACLMPKWMKNKKGKREDIKYYMIIKDSN